MTPPVVSLHPLTTIAVLAAAWLVVGFLAYWPPAPVRRAVEKCGGWPRIAGWVEIPLIGLVALGFLLAVIRALQRRVSHDSSGWPEAFDPFTHVAPLLGALLAVQLIRHAGAAIWVGGAVAFGGMVWLYTEGRAVFGRFLEGLPPEVRALHVDSYYIPMDSLLALSTLIPLLCAMTGLVCYALIRRWWSFALGGALLPALIIWPATALHSTEPAAVFTGMWNDSFNPHELLRWFARTLLFFGTLAALWAMPRTRAGLLRVSGLTEGTPPRSASERFRRAGAFFVVLMTGLLVAGHAIINVSMMNTWRLLEGGQTLKSYSPALVNGWDFLEERFSRGPQVPESPELPRGLLDLLEAETLEEARTALENVSPEVSAAFEREIEPWTEAFRHASRADYISPNDGERYVVLNHPHMRQTLRSFAAQAVMSTLQGEWEAAAGELEVLYRYGAMELDDGTIGQMIQVATRRMANDAAALYWQAFQQDREAMQALAAITDATAAGNRRSFPHDVLRRHEFGVQPVVPSPEIALPSFSRSMTVHQNSRANFDAVRMATAAALYRADNGEWPAALEDLAPVYLRDVPLDPFDGKPWIYEVDGERLLLETERHRGSEGTRSPAEPLSFPIIE